MIDSTGNNDWVAYSLELSRTRMTFAFSLDGLRWICLERRDHDRCKVVPWSLPNVLPQHFTLASSNLRSHLISAARVVVVKDASSSSRGVWWYVVTGLLSLDLLFVSIVIELIFIATAVLGSIAGVVIGVSLGSVIIIRAVVISI